MLAVSVPGQIFAEHTYLEEREERRNKESTVKKRDEMIEDESELGDRE